MCSRSVACGTLGRTQLATQIGYAKFRSRSHHAVFRVYDETGNVIETHEHAGDCDQFAKALGLNRAAAMPQPGGAQSWPLL
jgi:hypothetical protein